jgi:hypothetical protein
MGSRACNFMEAQTSHGALAGHVGALSAVMTIAIVIAIMISVIMVEMIEIPIAMLMLVTVIAAGPGSVRRR